VGGVYEQGILRKFGMMISLVFDGISDYHLFHLFIYLFIFDLLMSLSIGETAQCQIAGGLMNELCRMWRNIIMAEFLVMLEKL
jgi:hypothetical protein